MVGVFFYHNKCLVFSGRIIPLLIPQFLLLFLPIRGTSPSKTRLHKASKPSVAGILSSESCRGALFKASDKSPRKKSVSGVEPFCLIASESLPPTRSSVSLRDSFHPLMYPTLPATATLPDRKTRGNNANRNVFRNLKAMMVRPKASAAKARLLKISNIISSSLIKLGASW